MYSVFTRGPVTGFIICKPQDQVHYDLWYDFGTDRSIPKVRGGPGNSGDDGTQVRVLQLVKVHSTASLLHALQSAKFSIGLQSQITTGIRIVRTKFSISTTDLVNLVLQRTTRSAECFKAPKFS